MHLLATGRCLLMFVVQRATLSFGPNEVADNRGICCKGSR